MPGAHRNAARYVCSDARQNAEGAGHDGDKWRGAAGMPCTLPLLAEEVNDARRAASRAPLAAVFNSVCPVDLHIPTLIMSTQGGCAAGARGADFLLAADLAAEAFFAADIAWNCAEN